MPSAFAAFPPAAASGPGALAAAAAAAADQRAAAAAGPDARFLWDPSGRIHPTYHGHPG